MLYTTKGSEALSVRGGDDAMLKLLERNIRSVGERLIVLSPLETQVPDHFRNVTYDDARHESFVRNMQRLRGSVYLAEGNVRPSQLSPGGLHKSPEDARSWHLLMKDRYGHVTSCAWYLEHQNTASMDSLRVRNCPLARTAEWREALRSAVESELERARGLNLRYAEVGGWAVSKTRRCTSEGLLLALAAYGLCRILGGALGITTANVKHSSSSILRRLGGSYLRAGGTRVPAYFDPRYNADIELLRFDSRRPAPKYAGLIDLLGDHLSTVPVFARVPIVGAEPPWAAAAPRALVA